VHANQKQAVLFGFFFPQMTRRRCK